MGRGKGLLDVQLRLVLTAGMPGDETPLWPGPQLSLGWNTPPLCQQRTFFKRPLKHRSGQINHVITNLNPYTELLFFPIP